MPRLRKQTYEIFSQFAASGLSLAESYRRTTGRTAHADVKGSQWHRYAGVKERITELKAENAKRSQMTREELLDFYAEVIRTPADSVPSGSPVIQAYETTESGYKIRVCDKIAAGAQLQKMTGWNEPERVELTGDSLNAYIIALRRRPIGGGEVLELENGESELENNENGLRTPTRRE
jgi:Terminase small subunit